MKKLMFAAAALAAGFAMAEGEITSANIVGYQTKTTIEGQNFVSPTFKNVSSDKVSIQDIKLAGGAVTEYGDTLSILDAFGNPQEGKTFFWTADGWITDSFEPATLEIAPGEGVVVYTMNAAVGVQFAGEVRTLDLAIISVAGQNFLGNASPVEIDVQDVTLTGVAATEYGDTLNILDGYGNPKEGMTFFWTSGGWITDSFEPATLAIEAGDGIVIYTMNEGVEINLPGVTL